MAVSVSWVLSRNAKGPIQPGAGVRRQYRSMILFARGNGLVQQRPDFLAGDIARATDPSPSVAQLFRRCGEEFPFQGVEQRC